MCFCAHDVRCRGRQQGEADSGMGEAGCWRARVEMRWCTRARGAREVEGRNTQNWEVMSSTGAPRAAAVAHWGGAGCQRDARMGILVRTWLGVVWTLRCRRKAKRLTVSIQLRKNYFVCARTCTCTIPGTSRATDIRYRSDSDGPGPGRASCVVDDESPGSDSDADA